MKSNVAHYIFVLWGHLIRTRKLQIVFIFVLTLISVFAEMVTIGAVIPFLAALTEPMKLMQLEWFKPFAELLRVHSPGELLMPLTVGFVGIVVFATSTRILLLWMNTTMSASMGIQLRNDIYRLALYKPYTFHIAHNSSDLISLVTEKVGVVINAGIMHILLLATNIVMSTAIILSILLVNPLVALIAFLVLGGGYIFIGFLVRKKIAHNGEVIAKNQPKAVRSIQEGIGGIRDILIDGSQDEFSRSYYKVASKIQMASMVNSFFSNVPKSLLEMLSISLIALLAYYIESNEAGTHLALPVLGALALGAQRLLPSLQQIYFSWSTVNGAKAILGEVAEYLTSPLSMEQEEKTPTVPIPFKNEVCLKKLCFKYDSNEEAALHNIDLKIKHGQRIGFIGPTGSGKSTLIDVIMGLLFPTEGEMTVDGVVIDKKNVHQWQANIAHVPQHIFLADASIAENIAFGQQKSEIDMVRVTQAAKKADLHTFIESLPNAYDTSVGERGVQLSGGQRQRIGIARAMYKQANVIIMDEATSALDGKTEANVMQSINALNKDLTVLMIAHRLTTLNGCDNVYKLEKGKIVASGPYHEIINL
ncbi:ABC transporter ATP-binding protein [Thiomicrolovo sp. ZZH C-3]